MGVTPTAKPAHPAPPKPDMTVYGYAGKYDHAVFMAEVHRTILNTSYADTTDTDIGDYLTRIENDAGMTDLRWSAYMLATVFWETRSTVATTKPMFDKKGKPLVDKKGNPMMRTVHKMRVMQPIDESGHGIKREYYEPVKVQTGRPDGSILLTEHDGDQFLVNAGGQVSAIGKALKTMQADKHHRMPRGAPYLGDEDKDYTSAAGTEECYFGRGFVQLTWWDGYLAAGKELGIGTQLLTDPEKAKDPDIAYKLASLGMRTGKMFANGRKFSDYLNADKTDYPHARRMINAGDSKSFQPIADLAKKFEEALIKSRLTPPPPKPAMPPMPPRIP